MLATQSCSKRTSTWDQQKGRVVTCSYMCGAGCRVSAWISNARVPAWLRA